MRYATIRVEFRQRRANRCQGVEPRRSELVRTRSKRLAGQCATMVSPRPAGSWVCAQPSVRRHGRARCLTPPSSGHPQARFAHLRLPRMLNVMHYSHIAAGRVGSSVRAVARWARSQPDVRAAAVVGSWARGTARRRSDIDFMFLSTRPKARRASAQWAAQLASRALGSSLRSRAVRQYGVAWSLHARLRTGRELEFSFAPCSWAALHPVDPGTRRVVSEGMVVLHDPAHALSRLRRAVVRSRLAWADPR
jgi:predicted nucleotidyltransferase